VEITSPGRRASGFFNPCTGCSNISPSWRGVLDTLLCDKVSQGTLASSTDKTSHHDIAEMLLKVALNTIIGIKQFFLIYVLYFHFI
jgi:hypothetical protein